MSESLSSMISDLANNSNNILQALQYIQDSRNNNSKQEQRHQEEEPPTESFLKFLDKVPTNDQLRNIHNGMTTFRLDALRIILQKTAQCYECEFGIWDYDFLVNMNEVTLDNSSSQVYVCDDCYSFCNTCKGRYYHQAKNMYGNHDHCHANNTLKRIHQEQTNSSGF